MTARPSWDEYFMQMAELTATRSTCLRGQVGAVIVKDNQVIATGYNGPPRGTPHCYYPGVGGEPLHTDPDDCEVFHDCCHCNICVRTQMKIPSGERHELCRGLHGEQNAIVQAARHGVSIKDAKLYCNFQPCLICMKMIINAGITEVIYKKDYSDYEFMTTQMAEFGGVTLRKFDTDPQE